MSKLYLTSLHAVANKATAVFLLLLLTSVNFSFAKKTQADSPDFAYPKTVLDKANLNLSAAIAQRDWAKATQAAVQKITAQNLVSIENASSDINFLDSIIAVAPENWKPAFQLIEADLYIAIRSNIGWKTNQRTTDIDSISANPFEWSNDIFAGKVYDLCRNMLDNHDNDGKSLQNWNDFLTHTDLAYSLGMTIDEFIAKKCASLLNEFADISMDVIPFFNNIETPVTITAKCRLLRNSAYDLLIQKAANRGQSLIEAEAIVDKSKSFSQSLRPKFLMAEFNRLKHTEGSQVILNSMQWMVVSNNVKPNPSFQLDRRQYVHLLTNSIHQFPNGVYVNALRNILNSYLLPTTNLEYQNQYLSSDDISMKAILNNCNQSWILIYDYSKYAGAENPPNNSVVAKNCKLVKAIQINAEGTPPFQAETNALIGKLPPGNYVAIPSASPNSSGFYKSVPDRQRALFNVSDITAFTLNCLDGSTLVFVVDGENGKPIVGAEVSIFSFQNYYSQRQLAGVLTTNANGSVTVAEDCFKFIASYKDSKWDSAMRVYNTKVETDTAVIRKLSILTDRGVYQPGDSLNAAIIAYSSHGDKLNIDKNRFYTISLTDVNGKTLESIEVQSDNFGRASVCFKIPDNVLLGQFRLCGSDDSNHNVGYTEVEVADYVAPTFFITADIDDNNAAVGDTVVIKGQVLTYSGMPLANAKVNYHISFRPPMRWYASNLASFDSSVSSDNNGKYVISIPTDNLKDTQFQRGIFNINISATSPSGESQTGPSKRFSLGSAFTITSVNAISDIEISDSIPPFSIEVQDMLGRHIEKEVDYSLINKASGLVVANGSFTSPTLELPHQKYESAAYELKFSLKEDSEVTNSFEFVFWRKSDKKAPAGVNLWLPHTTYYPSYGQPSVNVVIGSGIPDRWIPAVISSDNTITDIKWLHILENIDSISVPVPAGRHSSLVDLCFISDLKIQTESVSICSPLADDYLRIITESFRDKVTAGDVEHWKFRFKRNLNPIDKIPVLAVMTDASLNCIAPFKWNFNPSPSYHYEFANFNCSNNSRLNTRFNLDRIKYISWDLPSYPKVNDYRQNWGMKFRMFDLYDNIPLTGYGTLSSSKQMVRGMAEAAPKELSVYASTNLDEKEEKIESIVADNEISASPSDGNTVASSDFRESECPVAFFMPYLATDDDGYLDLNFTLPNFNTTWNLQILGYDNSLQTARKQLETVASKPIMVSTHSPRFVRVGDVVQLSATIFNNSDVSQSVSGCIELVNLLSGEILNSKIFDAMVIEPLANRIISVSWSVPDDASAVGMRAFASTHNHRDGEQRLIPVLPASSPVIDATPFWLDPNQKKLELQLPKFNKSDRLTLQYCANPAWYCLSALPTIITTDSKSILSKANALYANTMAFNLISTHESLKKGLEILLSDKNSQFAALKSNLQKDGNIKISAIANTPWLNNAESETLRMSNLSSLLNDETASKTIIDQIKQLKKLQSSQGGWSWCPDMQPSLFITRSVLSNLAKIEKAGAFSQFKGTDGMIKAAIEFTDSEMLKDYKRFYSHNKSLSYLLAWTYVRGSFPSRLIPTSKSSKEMNSLLSKAIKDFASEWKSWDIFRKAQAAVVLWRAGNKKTAYDILESLRQFASVDPQKGTWFDNLESDYNAYSTLQTTTAVLEAFTEISPSDKMVDGIRQWLILSRQTIDWGKNSSLVQTINAILTSGSDWINANNKLPEFRLKSKKLQIPETAALSGAFTLNIDAKDASESVLSLVRNQNCPAWGGVISQYEAPIIEVKATDIPDLSIRKQFIALIDEDDGVVLAKETTSLKKGMKVRVTLTINNSRDMEYVALSDERCACLEPVLQVSGFTSTDDCYYYREVKNSVTNLYFEFLPKGHHVISYDCTVSADGTFSSGIATIQSQYSPLLVAHSDGSLLRVQ